MIFNNKFILASTSSSRYKILKNNKLNFFKCNPECNEAILKKKLIKKKISISKISLELARLKAKSISIKKKEVIIIGADTVISFKGRLLNKAKDLKEAKKIILMISENTHQIYSSATAYYNNKEIWNATQKSNVKIRKLSEEDVDSYILTTGKKILNCVGCYQVEMQGPNIVYEIKGDFYNVMGFPLFPFLSFLKKTKLNKKND